MAGSFGLSSNVTLENPALPGIFPIALFNILLKYSNFISLLLKCHVLEGPEPESLLLFFTHCSVLHA